MNFDFRYIQLPKKTSTIEDIEIFLKNDETKRIHFTSTHTNALKAPAGNYFGKITLPFSASIGPIISFICEGELGSYLFPSQYGGFWRGFSSQEDYELCSNFVNEYNHIVFLRDTLDLSIALSMNYDDDEHTEIGELEYQAKFRDDKNAENRLYTIVEEWLKKLPYYKVADAICAMPCSDPVDPSLPRRISNRMTIFENISDSVKWTNKTKKLKELSSVDEKLEALKEFGLVISSDLKGKNVILLDDLYMSGISMQFVAMKLKEAGAERVFGISIVKSRSNTAR
ncbi:phosphoribosyltransferase [Sphingobacterium siyangense]